MDGMLRVVRDNEIKFALQAAQIREKDDGTLWYADFPILGISDPAVKTRVAGYLRDNRYDLVPDDAWVRIGYNNNGVWAGYDKEWDRHPAKAIHDKREADRLEKERKQVTIYLSSRGWGDYSPAEWIGDITRPDAEILAECKTQLTTGHDADTPNQTDEQILTRIATRREKWENEPARKAAMEAAEAADIQHKIDSGYCFACESWCHGNCGHYSNSPRVRFLRDLRDAQRKADYGITD